jgi:xanthine dehydrogenase YagR molybdenum-binding subunit
VEQAKALPGRPDKKAGDADAAMTRAAHRLSASYRLPVQHQNPIELLATVAEWEGDMLTLHEPTQNSSAVGHGVAQVLGLEPSKVRVISSSLGGGFGQKNSTHSHVALAALAARRLGRPVKIVMPRSQIFHTAGFRPMSIHKVQLAADEAGKIIAAIHEIDQQTSRHDLLFSPGTEVTLQQYGIPHLRSHDRLVRVDTQTPGFMRTPFEAPASFAFESALDEFACQLNRDPVALRLAHDTRTDPLTGKPFSSRHAAECLRMGAERFGWKRRTMAPRSMRAADGALIGWGVALGSYKASTAPAIARVRLKADGTVHAAVGVHEMGQGVRSAIVPELARALGVPLRAIRLSLGDTADFPHHNTAGSWGTATAVPTALEAAQKLVAELRQRAPDAPPDATALQLLQAANLPEHQVEVRRRPPGQGEQVWDRLDRGLQGAVGPEYPEFVSFSYVAHFVEVRVEPRTRRIRVPRVVSVADCGRVVSERTARSQLLGGIVWGIGQALREAGETDPRFGGFLNADLAEYLVPVHADIGSISAYFVNEPDTRINPSGVKGLGEVALSGMAAAIANAVHHATGRRVRHLPIRIEDVL